VPPSLRASGAPRGGRPAGQSRHAVREFQPAALWRRFAARLVDSCVGLLAWSLAAMWLVVGGVGLRRGPLGLREVALLLLAVAALGAALHVVYHVAFIGGCGQTPGKMALGIAVVRRDGERAGTMRAMVRCLAGMVSALTLGLASLGVLFTRERR